MTNQICIRGLWDTSVPGITFDKDGISNYANMFDHLCTMYPRGLEGKKIWDCMVNKMKMDGLRKQYDCVVGVSGGTDSCYLLHLLKNEYGLRPLAVNLDNGWSSEIAVKNIKKVTEALSIDLETYVINYEEVKSVLRAYLKASLPWVDAPTDMAIKATLYKTAAREGIKYALNGSDFRSEGKQPSEWTYSDSRLFKAVIKKYENVSLQSFPFLTMVDIVYYSAFKGIKLHRPFYYLDYSKKEAQDLLSEKYGWQYYGGHHYENIFTKFVIGYWLPKKFNIDKRIVTLSSQVLSGELLREVAFELLQQAPYDSDQMEKDKDYVLKKLDLSEDEFTEIWNRPNKYYWNYPSYLPLIKRFSKVIEPIVRNILKMSPPLFKEKSSRTS